MTQTTQADPATIARSAFKQLALRKAAPTPDNYARFYAEAAQVKLGEVLPVWAVLEAIARDIRDDPLRSSAAKAITEALGKADWEAVRRGFKVLLQDTAAPPKPQTPPPSAIVPAAPDKGTVAHETILALKDLFRKTIDYLIDERSGFPNDNVEQWKALVGLTEMADAPAKVNDVAAKLKNLWLKLELRGEGPEATIRNLHGLLMLLLDNVGDLVPGDQWVQKEVDRIQGALGAKLSSKSLSEAERALKEFGYRQTSIRTRIEETNTAIRNMMAVFIERLGTVTVSTGEFSTRLAHYSESIRSGKNLTDLAEVLADLVKDTDSMQSDMSRTHTELDETRVKVAEYEAHVRELEVKLSAANELVREDALTRVLNRRGLEQQFVVEEARARRRGKPLAIAMLDLDDFKKLNDRLGHQAGDAALRRVVEVVRHSLRPTDSVARYGGEEFVVLLPEADAAAGAVAINRVLSDLAARPLQWDGSETSITFSAGIVTKGEDESLESVIARADGAMYEAKRAGKNRVVSVR
jgi:diguanylate cyclase